MRYRHVISNKIRGTIHDYAINKSLLLGIKNYACNIKDRSLNSYKENLSLGDNTDIVKAVICIFTLLGLLG